MKNILKKLYDYQRDAILATDNNEKGIVCMPTGTGKTFVQGAAIAKEIMLNKNKFGIYVINAPRIMLSYQLLKEVYSFLIAAGIDARYMSVHSGGSSDKEELEEIRKDANLNDGYNIKYAEIESRNNMGAFDTYHYFLYNNGELEDVELKEYITYEIGDTIVKTESVRVE